MILDLLLGISGVGRACTPSESPFNFAHSPGVGWYRNQKRTSPLTHLSEISTVTLSDSSRSPAFFPWIVFSSASHTLTQYSDSWAECLLSIPLSLIGHFSVRSRVCGRARGDSTNPDKCEDIANCFKDSLCGGGLNCTPFKSVDSVVERRSDVSRTCCNYHSFGLRRWCGVSGAEKMAPGSNAACAGTQI